MAKRKASKKRKTTRRRRMGGIGALNANNPLVKFGSIAAGYFLGDKINTAIDSATGDKMDGKLLAGLQTFAGLTLNGVVPVMKGKRGLIATVAGGVLAGSGLKRGLTEFGVINGFHNVPALNGWRAVPALNGYNPTPGAQLGAYNPTPSKVMGSVPPPAEMIGAEDGSGINASDR